MQPLLLPSDIQSWDMEVLANILPMFRSTAHATNTADRKGLLRSENDSGIVYEKYEPHSGDLNIPNQYTRSSQTR